MRARMLPFLGFVLLSIDPALTLRNGRASHWIGSKQQGLKARRCSPCIATLHLDPTSVSQGTAAAGASAGAATEQVPPRFLIRHHEPGAASSFEAMMAVSDAAVQHAASDHQQTEGDSHDPLGPSTDKDRGMGSDNNVGGDSFLIHVVYSDSYISEGWDRLEIRVNDRVPIPDIIKAHAAGYAEAYFTGDQIHKYWTNYRLNEFAASGGVPSPALLRYIRRQASFVRSSVAVKGRSAKYWRLMGLVMSQFDGLCEGYWANVGSSSHNMTWEELYLLQSVGDLYDLNVLFPPHKQPHGAMGSEAHTHTTTTRHLQGSAAKGGAAAVAAKQQRRYTPGHGEVGPWGFDGAPLECSAAIKLHNDTAQRLRAAAGQAGGVSPRAWRSMRAGLRSKASKPKEQMFWAGHATWRPYYAMIRTWKAYDLPWSETGPLVVSSSPGLLFSKDDWYTTDTLVIMETTNGVYNKTLYDLIPEECALMWQRVLVANLGATGGKEWVELFAKHNSGTYNNQWMVLDVDALESGWQHDVLWVLEQLPGMTQQADMTSALLHQGYWVSYNVPFFPAIYNMSGYPTDINVYESAPRALIFAREIPHIQSTEELQNLLRLNRYQEDPLSDGRPNNAIASRYDLNPIPGHRANWTRKGFGAVDAKVIDHEGFSTRTTHVICGPTSDDQPPFRWSTSGLPSNISHIGSVDQFDFGWQTYTALQNYPDDNLAAVTAGASHRRSV